MPKVRPSVVGETNRCEHCGIAALGRCAWRRIRGRRLPRPAAAAPGHCCARLLRCQAPSGRLRRPAHPATIPWRGSYAMESRGRPRDKDLEPVASIAPSTVSQCPWHAAPIFGRKELRRREAPLGKMAPAAFACSSRSAGPILPSCAKFPPPVPLAAKKSARPWGPCEDGSGCDGSRQAPRSISLLTGYRPLPAADASLVFAGPLVAALWVARTHQARWKSVKKTMR